MSEFVVLAIIKQLLDKLQTAEVERILTYFATYLEQRIDDDDMKQND